MRLAAILAVLLLYAGNAFACPYHTQTTASDDQAAQSGDQQLPKAKSGS